jgi:hypothetical protein
VVGLGLTTLICLWLLWPGRKMEIFISQTPESSANSEKSIKFYKS